MLQSPQHILNSIAQRARTSRLNLGLTQEGLAKRSGVSLGSIKRFEHTGQISLSSLIKVAVVLGRAEELETLFEKKMDLKIASLDQLLEEEKTPKRGRIH